MRPIDLLDNMSKAPLAGREQGIQQASADQGQRHGAQALNREHLLDQTRPTEAEDVDVADNRLDDHPDDGSGDRGRRRRHDGKDHEPETSERPRVSATSREIDLMA